MCVLRRGLLPGINTSIASIPFHIVLIRSASGSPLIQASMPETPVASGAHRQRACRQPSAPSLPSPAQRSGGRKRTDDRRPKHKRDWAGA